MSAYNYRPQGPVSRFVHVFEETAIAVLLGLMTMVTFTNVVLRYVFNDAWIWGLELTLVLFAWLVLFGVSYCVKVTAHLGVDAITTLLPPGPKRILALLSAIVCLIYAFLLLKGAWDFWAPFAGFERTSGRWFPTGFEATRSNTFYESDQIPIPFAFLRDWLSVTFNSFMEGDTLVTEQYEKMPRLVPYFILPFGCALLLLRFLQAAVGLIRGTRAGLIVSHEAEEAVQKVAAEDARV